MKMKKQIHILCALMLTTVLSCQRDEDMSDIGQTPSNPSSEICASGIMEVVSADERLETRALIGSETVASLEGNFIQISEPKQSWTEESQYVMTSPEDMPSFKEAKIVEGEIISSPDNSAARLRSIVFRPKLVYDYYSRDESQLDPDIAYVSRMVGWYPMTYDVPAGVDGKDAIAWFKNSGSMVELPDGKIGVRFEKKLDGQTDLMMTDMREGRMYKSGFKHTGSTNDYDIQPYGHAYLDPLNINEYRYLNYFTFHHYLTAVKLYVQTETDGKGVIGTINNVKFLDQPTSVTIALPESQVRGGGTGPVISGTTATLPIEGVQPVFGELVGDSWADFKDINIIRTPMMADPSDQTVSQLPVLVPPTTTLEKTYLGYALLRPWGGDGDTYQTRLEMHTDAGIYPITIPNVLSEDSGGMRAGDPLLQPGKIYELTITIKNTGGLEVVISNEDDEKYRNLSPYNESYGSYEYSNCYMVTDEMLEINGDSEKYAGFYFRTDVPGRGPAGDIENDPYEADHVLSPHSVSLLWQDAGQPIRHVELVQGAVRFKLKTPFTPGNAVLGAYDEDGQIIWSWHIWLCNETVSAVNDIIMDRNLGAMDKTYTGASDILDTYGLYYQWGRKDPTMGPMTWNYNIFDMRTAEYHTIDGERNDVSEVYMSGAAPSIIDGVRNPTVILAPSDLSPDYIYDWLYYKEDDLWGGISGKKTIYDPCPYGYKVPTDEIREFLASGTTRSQHGLTKNELFFPSAGWKGDDVKSATRSHAWMAVGKAGDYQDATVGADFNRGRRFFVTQQFYVPSTKRTYNAGDANSTYTSRTIAAPVRCVRYDKEPL